jgi:hypothetical protein
MLKDSVDECFPLRDILRPAIEQQTVVGALHQVSGVMLERLHAMRA